jgi:hypothetical protein
MWNNIALMGDWWFNMLRTGTNEHAVDNLNIKIKNLIDKNVNSNCNKLKYDKHINVKKWWQQVNREMGKNKSKTSGTLNLDTLDQLNKVFADICTSNLKCDYREYIQESNGNICKLEIGEVYKSLTRLKKTATGPDEIDYWILKENAETLAPIITTIYNKCLECEIWPDSWKCANVCPIQKSFHLSNALDYRPISITDVLYRMFERLVFEK